MSFILLVLIFYGMVLVCHMIVEDSPFSHKAYNAMWDTIVGVIVLLTLCIVGPHLQKSESTLQAFGTLMLLALPAAMILYPLRKWIDRKFNIKVIDV